MPKIVVITVVGVVPNSVTLGELNDFVDDALSTWGGQRHPDDHLFSSIDVRSVKTQNIAKLPK
jgi:hypothetical protein